FAACRLSSCPQAKGRSKTCLTTCAARRHNLPDSQNRQSLPTGSADTPRRPSVPSGVPHASTGVGTTSLPGPARGNLGGRPCGDFVHCGVRAREARSGVGRSRDGSLGIARFTGGSGRERLRAAAPFPAARGSVPEIVFPKEATRLVAL